jgi:hypothetical protein
MATGPENKASRQATIIAFAPALQRRRDREQFFRLHGEWINPYRDGIDGLWVGHGNAEIIPWVSDGVVHGA